MAGPRYDTVLERCTSRTEKIDWNWHIGVGRPCHLGHLAPEGPDPVRLAQVKDVIETFVTGRKFEVLRLRAQGKSFSEIALLLSISKGAVRRHYRRAVQQVRQALGFEFRPIPPRIETSAAFPPA